MEQEIIMKYISDYRLFEEENKVDLKDELTEIGKDLKTNAEDMQDFILKLAQSDPEIKQKVEDKKDNKEEVNEGLLLGAALSSGAVLELVGKFLKFIGKKISKDDKSRITKIGTSIEKYGHNIQHKVINVINTILKPLIFWLPRKNRKIFPTLYSW